MIPEQCRAARALLDWTTRKLAEASHLDNAIVEDFEKGLKRPAQQDIVTMKRVLEQAGVEFLPADGGGPGVRLQRGGAGTEAGLKPSELNAANDG
ncbi:transcriptional regulator [Consotaella salsifontis]|uniref:Helix-turn-helix n=1 Tax=Consotaella salsifontis TaxID=1365950 RepID=A0A1T4SRR4_9HYPH|nr:transcriptional regulator [Consotaella salsifontis]SKA30853.1 hypothetical protein SAMN05428963_11374 [Consotaella salsifontis]